MHRRLPKLSVVMVAILLLASFTVLLGLSCVLGSLAQAHVISSPSISFSGTPTASTSQPSSLGSWLDENILGVLTVILALIGLIITFLPSVVAIYQTNRRS